MQCINVVSQLSPFYVIFNSNELLDLVPMKSFKLFSILKAFNIVLPLL